MSAPWSFNLTLARWPGWVTSGSEHELWYQLGDTHTKSLLGEIIRWLGLPT